MKKKEVTKYNLRKIIEKEKLSYDNSNFTDDQKRLAELVLTNLISVLASQYNLP